MSTQNVTIGWLEGISDGDKEKKKELVDIHKV